VCVINSFQGSQCRYFSRKIPRYQMGNQKLQFEEEQTIQAMDKVSEYRKMGK
jgi:hypothetical protein